MYIINFGGEHLAKALVELQFPSNKKPQINAGLMLGQRRRRWPNISPALAHRLMLTGFMNKHK